MCGKVKVPKNENIRHPIIFNLSFCGENEKSQKLTSIWLTLISISTVSEVNLIVE